MRKFFWTIILIIFIIQSYESQLLSYDYQFPKEDNFVIKYLNTMTLQERIQKVNQQMKDYFEIDAEVQNTNYGGLGIFLNQKILKNQIIVKYKERKILSSHRINFGMFFQNSLSKQASKINIYKEILKNEWYKKFLLVMNMFYHLVRIEHSFLKYDILGFPSSDYIAPIFKIQEDEITYFDEQKKYEILKEHKQIRSQYEQLVQCIGNQISKEQQNLFFNKEEIDFNEYLYFDFILKTRVHHMEKDIILYPFYHYANMFSNERNTHRAYHQRKNHYIKIFNDEEQQGNEYLINYGYPDAFTYLFQCAFLPDVEKLYCPLVEVFKKDISNLSSSPAQKYGINHNTCITEKTLEAYSMAQIMESLAEFRIKKCDNLVVYYNFEDPILKLQAMFHACKYIYKKLSFKSIWTNPLNQLNKMIDQTKQTVQDYEIKMQTKIQQGKDYQVIKLLILFGNHQIKKQYQSLEILQKFILNYDY